MVSNPLGSTSNVSQSCEIFAQAAPEESTLMEIFNEMMNEDSTVADRAYEAANEAKTLPIDPAIDQRTDVRVTPGQDGIVQRRAPPNPLHSSRLGLRPQAKTQYDQIADPALAHAGLKGRLLVTIGVNCALFLVFSQSLIYNFLSTGSYYVSYSDNTNVGPSAASLYGLGGLNANAIRRGETVRLYWSMWMHSGWLHILLNIACQLQYFYMLEPDWGSKRSLFVFYFSALTGNLLSVCADPCKTTVGSSGGLFGLMGAIIPYCFEFWYTIPRPLFILIFSVIVALVSLLTGFTQSTDSWAHLGGLIGGTLLGFITLKRFTLTQPSTELVLKGETGGWYGTIKRFVTPRNCSNGLNEWLTRIIALSSLITMWTVCYVLLYVRYEYSPVGSITFKGMLPCCCCYEPDTVEYTRENWTCNSCSETQSAWNGKTWGEQCSSSAARRALAMRSHEDQDYPDIFGEAIQFINPNIPTGDSWAQFTERQLQLEDIITTDLTAMSDAEMKPTARDNASSRMRLRANTRA